MRIEQWYIAVPKRGAETERRNLIQKSLLDRALKPRAEGDMLLLPVCEEIPGALRGEFEALPKRPVLPRHELVGGIAIMQEEDQRSAELLLSSRPSLHTVLLPQGPVEGEYRTRRFTVLAGKNTTRTEVTEYGLTFSVDLSLAYFSARLAGERQRIRALMREGERVLDMFAGVGPFAITLADKARVVFASDINPDAVALMISNTTKNRARTVVPLLADALHLSRIGLAPFDRIVMNLPLAAPEFLDAAFALCRSGGQIHLYALQEQEGQYLPNIKRMPCADVREHLVRTYSPGRWHAVYDITVGKKEE